MSGDRRFVVRSVRASTLPADYNQVMSSSANRGVCKLCGRTKPLCRSHVVPEFAYRPIKNAKGQIYAAGRKTKKVQTGYSERLLCVCCEQRLNAYETAFKKAWMDTIPSDFRHLRTRALEDVISVDIPDYATFKLFHLSVLWRAAVSSGFKIGGGISLGRYEAEIAQMLRDGDPGRPGDFPFFGVLNLGEDKRPVPTVAPLAHGAGRYEGHHYYLMSYAYCDWFFFVARPGPKWMAALEAKCRAQSMCLLLTVPYTESKSFDLWVEILRKFGQ